MGETVHRSEWLRGVLELCVLRTVSAGPTYGYAITADLAAAGLGDIKGGTLYPLLSRLEKNGLVVAEWRAGEGGPGRKYFVITDTGRAELADGTAQWQAFTSIVGTHLSGGTPSSVPPGTPAPHHAGSTS